MRQARFLKSLSWWCISRSRHGVRLHTTPLPGCAHLPRILYRSVIYGYFIIIGHPFRWSPPVVTTLTLQTWMRWIEKKRTTVVRREHSHTTAKERYQGNLYPISSFVDITLGCYQALIWHAWMINFWQSKWTHHGDTIFIQPSAINNVERHNFNHSPIETHNKFRPRLGRHEGMSFFVRGYRLTRQYIVTTGCALLEHLRICT